MTKFEKENKALIYEASEVRCFVFSQNVWLFDRSLEVLSCTCAEKQISLIDGRYLVFQERGNKITA